MELYERPIHKDFSVLKLLASYSSPTAVDRPTCPPTKHKVDPCTPERLKMISDLRALMAVTITGSDAGHGLIKNYVYLWMETEIKTAISCVEVWCFVDPAIHLDFFLTRTLSLFNHLISYFVTTRGLCHLNVNILHIILLVLSFFSWQVSLWWTQRLFSLSKGLSLTRIYNSKYSDQNQ